MISHRRKKSSNNRDMDYNHFRSASPANLFSKGSPREWSATPPPPYPRSPIPYGSAMPLGRKLTNDRHRSASSGVNSPNLGGHRDEQIDQRRHGDEEEEDKRCGHTRLENFARDTTIHGVGQILRDDQPFITRMIWTIAFLTAALACICLIGLSFQRYLKFDVKTTTSMTTEEEIDFPAITICNENMLMKSLIGASPDTIKSFTAVVVSNIGEYDTKLAQAMRSCSNNASEYTERLSDKGGYQWFREIGVNKVMHIFALDSYKSLISCWWTDRPENCSKYFLNHMTDFGWCFTLNPSALLLRGFNLGLRWNDTGYGLPKEHEQLTLRSTGPNNGFKMLLNVNQEEYCVTRTDAAGFKVLIHDPSVQPMFFLERPLSMSPGFETSVAIRYTRQVKKTQDLGKCIKFRPLEMFPNAEVYFKEACYMQCYTNYIYEHCNCTPLYGPPRANYEKAKLVKRDYVHVCWDYHFALCMKKRERQFLDEGLQALCKDCKDPCEFTLYDIQVSTAYFPADNFHYLYDNVMNRTSDHEKVSTSPYANKNYEHDTYIRRNLVLANFYVESMQISMITETHAFTADQLVADVGGQVGFLLGMSMLSLFEFIQCLMPRKKVEERGRKRRGDSILLIFTNLLVASGYGVCINSKKLVNVDFCTTDRISIEYWSSANGEGIEGQYFVFASTSLLWILSILTVAYSDDGQKCTLVAVFGIIIALVNIGLELNYTANRQVIYAVMKSTKTWNDLWDDLSDLWIYNQSWAAATALYFVLLFLYILDLIFDCQRPTVVVPQRNRLTSKVQNRSSVKSDHVKGLFEIKVNSNPSLKSA